MSALGQKRSCYGPDRRLWRGGHVGAFGRTSACANSGHSQFEVATFQSLSLALPGSGGNLGKCFGFSSLVAFLFLRPYPPRLATSAASTFATVQPLNSP